MTFWRMLRWPIALLAIAIAVLTPLWRHGLFRYRYIVSPNDPHIRQPLTIAKMVSGLPTVVV
jgi:hypothetical protein